jgi:ADP-ribosylglycohydrolase
VDPDTQNVGIVEELLGSKHDEVAKRLQQELQIYSYSYTSFIRSPGGCADCGAPSRAAPLGLVLPHADVQQLRRYLEEALACSHPDSTALDAATVVAAAVQWLSQAEVGAASCTPEKLLEQLLEVAATSDMRGRLLLVRDNLVAMPQAADWRDVWSSREWHNMLQVHQWCSQRGFATDSHDAVAVALHCLCCNWRQPRQAVECAAHLGGWACVTASMVGAMAGALHGTEWIPTSWWDSLEGGDDGRELAVQLGQQLARADFEVPPPAVSSRRVLPNDDWYL